MPSAVDAALRDLRAEEIIKTARQRVTVLQPDILGRRV
jgi:hypothetical protein